MSLRNISSCSNISSPRIEEPVTLQVRRSMIPKFFSQPVSAKKEAGSQGIISKLQLSANSGEDGVNTSDDRIGSIKSESSWAGELNDSRYQKATLPNLEFRKHLGSIAFKPRMCKIVQPSDPCGEELRCTQTDLSADESQLSRSQASTISQNSDGRQKAQPLFSLCLDTQTNVSCVIPITPKSLSRLEIEERESQRSILDSSKKPIDTNVDLLFLLKKNPHLVDFHLKKSAGPSKSANMENKYKSTTAATP